MGKRSHYRAVLSSSPFKAAKSKKATLAASAFDVIRAKPHHSVLNQSKRGLVKNQTAANERSISRRKESLLLELQSKERQNAFVDRRIGEKEAGQRQRVDGSGAGLEAQLQQRDVMAERFVKERMRKLRKGRTFNIDEAAGGEEEELTHAGQALSTVHFTPQDADEDDEGNDRHAGRIDASQVHALHFGGGPSDPYAIRAAMGRGDAAPAATAPRTKKEVMDEIILKSKMYKAEKAEEVAAQAGRVSSLDDDFSSIRAFLDFKDSHDAAPTDTVAAVDDDDFVRQARMLAEEATVKAAERVKSPEEQAKEERERMDRLERARLRRMRGEEGADDDEEVADHGIGSRRKRRREQEKRERREEEEQRKKAKLSAVNATDDDLVDNFIVDKDTRRRQQRQEEEEEQEAEEEEEDDEEGQGQGEGEDGAAADGDAEDDEEESAEGAALSSDEADDDDDESIGDAASRTNGASQDAQGQEDSQRKAVESATSAAAAAPRKAVTATAEDEVPFVFPPPTSHRHLVALLAPYPSSFHPLIYRRMHSYHFLALTSDNRGRMESFTTALLTHFHSLCKRHSPTTSTLASLLAHLDPLTSILFDLTQLLPSHTAAAARQLLSTLSISTSSAADLLTAKLLFGLFPSSDARHNVVTPLFIHLAATLHYAPLRSAADVLRALFTCQLLLHATQQSKRYVPELLNTLYGVLLTGWGMEVREGEKPAVDGLRPLYSKLFTDDISVWQRAGAQLAGADAAEQAGWRVDLQAMFLVSDESSALPSSPAFLCSLFALTLRLVGQASRLYDYLPSYPELFTPFHAALTLIDRSHSASLPPSLSTLLHSTLSTLTQRLRAPRPSFLRPTPPPSIRLRTPAYVEGYQPGKDYDPVRERAELRELTRKMKREKRGAEKEVRKDAEFVRAEQGRGREAVEAAKAEKRRANFRDMEAQARDSNLLHKQSKKKRSK